jgi:hypothetical protein
MKNLVLYSLIFLLFFSGSNATLRKAYKPIYISNEEAKTIVYTSPQEIKNQGKIYIKDQWIFIGDVNLGVHIIDNSDPEHPQKIGFLKIYGNHDIAIKGNTLFADNFRDMVAIDISNMEEPVITKRVKDVYTLYEQNYPPNVPYGTYFECIDPAKGFVISWEVTEVENAECYTTY